MKLKSLYIQCTLAAALLLGYSCKKTSPVINEDTTPAAGSAVEIVKDSVALYAKQIYYWQDKLQEVSAFNPRSHGGSSDDVYTFETVLKDYLYTAVNPATGKAYEYYREGSYLKYSYMENIKDAYPDAKASRANVNTLDVGNDIGIKATIYYFPNSSNAYKFYIVAVEPNSPAAKAGLHRGLVIKKINTVDGVASSGFNTTVQNSLFDQLESSKVTITPLDPLTNKTLPDVTLVPSVYKTNPVYASKILNLQGNKIGYICLARFSVPDSFTPAVDSVINSFGAAGITNLVVDLRYNGGGYVASAEHLLNAILPSSAAGILFTEKYNDKLRNKQASLLKLQPAYNDDGTIQKSNGKNLTLADVDYNSVTYFNKSGSLTGVQNIYFLVTANTASASELVINAAKPFVTTKLIGSTTYGKPVGFFPIRLGHNGKEWGKYNAWIASFETVNKNNEGGYYTGMMTDINSNEFSENLKNIFDFTDERDPLLLSAIKQILPSYTSATGSSTQSTSRNISATTPARAGGSNINPQAYPGLIKTFRAGRK